MKSKGRHSRAGMHSGPGGNSRRGRARLVSVATAGVLAVTGVGMLGASTASATPAPQVASSYTSYVPWIFGTVTPRVNGLRIRSGPGTSHYAYGLLYRGDRMRVTAEVRRGSAGYWCKVTLTRRSASGLPAGFSGWVYAPYLRHV